MNSWHLLTFQNSASPLMEQIIMFHDYSLIILIMITMFIMYMMSFMFVNKIINRYLIEQQMIELIWTIIPGIILIFIALPSLKLLYLLDEVNKPLLTLKTIGHQWFWSYEYSDYKNINFDSYMTPSINIEPNNFRLIETDNRIILPMNSQIRVLTTSTDVIHSWTIPNLGIKSDAVPGRINQMNFILNRPGLYYGQCSEICGTNHSFMPITIESISMKNFINWIKNYQ